MIFEDRTYSRTEILITLNEISPPVEFQNKTWINSNLIINSKIHPYKLNGKLVGKIDILPNNLAGKIKPHIIHLKEEKCSE